MDDPRPGPATILEAPEGESWIALVDVAAKDAKDADAAVAAGWAAYKPDAKWPLKLSSERPDRNGWSKLRVYDYQTSPNERRDLQAVVRSGGGSWSVLIYDVSQPVGEKRGAQTQLIFDRLQPKGYVRETFAGKQASRLDAARLAELERFVDSGLKALGVPGAAVGIVENGKVAFRQGFGVRDSAPPSPWLPTRCS